MDGETQLTHIASDRKVFSHILRAALWINKQKIVFILQQIC